MLNLKLSTEGNIKLSSNLACKLVYILCICYLCLDSALSIFEI